MKEKTAERLAGAVEELLEFYRISTKEFLEAMLGVSGSPEFKRVVRIGQRAGLKHSFKDMEEPSKQKLKETLSMLETLKSAPHKVRSILKQGIKELPRAPGGPPRKLTPDQEKMACAEVAALRADIGSREAIQRVARKRVISERTMYRIWRKHHRKRKS
jgi:hypothetical protein